MCGLWGVAGPGIQKKDLEAFVDLGIISQLRGMEGAGVWQMKSTGSRKVYENWYKTSCSFQEMLDEISGDKEYKDLMHDIQCDVLIGHVRQPTRGKRTSSNAHPFVYNSIVGAHNGTLRDFKYWDNDRTDSELMFTEMTSRGIVPVLRDLDEDSAYAITVYDFKTNALFFARNEKRPMTLAILKNRNVVFWASEVMMLKLVLTRMGEEYVTYNLPVGKVIKVYPSKISNSKEPWILHHDFAVEAAEKKAQREKEIEERLQKAMGNELKDQSEGKKPKTGQIIHLGSHPRVSLPQVSIQTSTQRASLKSFYRKCSCGAKTLNLLDVYRAQKGEDGFHISYDHINDKFYCDSCLKNMLSEEVKNA